jgi:hypothetical protein
MAIVDKRLCKGTLSNANATLYAVPAVTTAIVKALTLCNKSASAATVTLSFAGVEILCAYTLSGYETLTIPFMDQILAAEELIEGLSGTDAVINYYISGKEVS